jgi:hypothetical protein
MVMDKSKVVEAVNLLIGCERYARVAKELCDLLDTYDTYPMAYAGRLAPLNTLLDIGLESRETFDRLLKYVEEKRKLLPKQRRVDYQRELMAQRRARIAKAIELEELLHGEMDATTRDKYVKGLQGRWAEHKDKFLKSLGELTWEQRNKRTAEFWDAIDQKLEANIANERQRKKL